MKHNFFRVALGLIIVVALLLMLTMGFLTKPSKEIIKPAGAGFAVIELFTSEGCSSCPKADAEVQKMSVSRPDDVYVLGFHVDYWNRLGWKDEFSNAAYSERQRGYADHFNLSGVYTPQVVVNGKKQFVGSDAAQLQKTVDTEIKNAVNQSVELSAVGADGKTVAVTYNTGAPDNSLVNIALVQRAAQTDVKQGENEGRTLRHINIVRDFTTISVRGKSGTASLTLPGGINAKDCKVIAYLQRAQAGEITAVAATFIK